MSLEASPGRLLPGPCAPKPGWPWTEPFPVDGYAESSLWPSISLVTPSFQQGHYLEETIRSVLLQNYPRCELIVIDGGSSDGSMDVLMKYAPWLKYWVSEPDRGQADALNKGFAHASGDIVNWLNSDDVLERGALYRVGQTMREADPTVEAVMFGCKIRVGDEDKGAPEYGKPGASVAETMIDAGGYQPALFFRRDSFERLLPVDETLHFSMDFELWMRHVASRGPGSVRFLHETVAKYRLHPGSKTVSAASGFRRDDLELACRMASRLQDPAVSEVMAALTASWADRFRQGQVRPRSAEYATLDAADLREACARMCAKVATSVESAEEFRCVAAIVGLSRRNAFAKDIVLRVPVLPAIASKRHYAIYRAGRAVRRLINSTRDRVAPESQR